MTMQSGYPGTSGEMPASDARAQLRRVVLQTAAQLLAQNPQASIDDIAQASGIGRATLYRWFATRDQLVEAILAELLTEAHQIARAALAERGIAPLAVIQSMAHEFLALGERYRFMETSLEHESEDELRTEFIAFVSEAQAAGKLRDQLPAEWIGSLLASVVIAASKEVHSGHLSRLRAEELMDHTLALLLDPGEQAS